MEEKTIADFKNPACEFRGAPFWAWNGKMEPEELRRQIRLMREMGLGGFFMHARVGLNTEYLGKEWFECVNACIDEAEKQGMYAWLYDEDRWPSGAGGGLVTRNPEYRARFIVADEIADPAAFQPNDATIAVFTGRIAGDRIAGAKRVTDGKPRPGDGEKIVHFYVRLQDPSAWFNGQTYLDTLNEKAVAKFIEITHEKYRREIAAKFGGTVPGIFTDEPFFGSCPGTKLSDHEYSTPWTGVLPDVFKKRYDYDLIDHLVELFYEVEGIDPIRTRHDYMDCLTHLFSTSYAKQIGSWCEKNKMLSTGHLLCEDTLSLQTGYVGSCMRSYEYMQAPGMDELTEYWRIYDTAKQVTSAARQFGRKWRLSETYGCSGWDFPFAGHKAISDWQAALGINLRCQHLYWYTMKGEAKRDYPAAISYQSPWWNEYSYVEDYFARINMVMIEGQEVRDLLVIHPVESMWTKIKKDWVEKDDVKAANSAFVALRDCIHDANIDFDYGDEEIMSRHARVVRNNGVAVLQVAQAQYRAVVVPELITMRSSTLKLLADFQSAGGRVVMVGAPAGYLDGVKSEAVREFSRNVAVVAIPGEELIAQLSETARNVSITGPKGKEIPRLLHLLRASEDHCALFVCNTGYAKALPTDLSDHIMTVDRVAAYPEVTIKLKTAFRGELLEFDPVSGEVFRATAEKTADGWTIRTSLAEVGSRLFVAAAKASRRVLPVNAPLQTVSQQALAPAEWRISRAEDNVLMLDRPQYRIGDGDWQGKEYVLFVDRKIREHLGLMPRGGGMVQPWVRGDKISPATVGVELQYEFNCETIPDGALFLGIEEPERYRITVNGTMLSPDMECGWWCDHSLRKLPVEPSLLHVGSNEIRLTLSYNEACGLEFIYLLGDFGVIAADYSNTLTAAPRTLRLGDWGPQFLPYYSGRLTYHTEVDLPATAEKVFLRLPEFRGVAAVVYVNGKRAGLVGFPPYEAEITTQLQPGKNRVAIEILNSRRNSHGPFHFSEKWPVWTGPGEFQLDCGKLQLVPGGLIQPPVLEFRK